MPVVHSSVGCHGFQSRERKLSLAVMKCEGLANPGNALNGVRPLLE